MRKVLVKDSVKLVYVRAKKMQHSLYFNCNEKMCKNCTKYHNRGPLTRSHQVSLLIEITCTHLVPNHNKGEVCILHQGIPIMLFCQEHEEPCCQICASTSHEMSTCWINRKNSNKYENIFWGIELWIVCRRSWNNSKQTFRCQMWSKEDCWKMKNRADTISDETERAFDEAIQHMQFLKKNNIWLKWQSK